jgi:hypothetical protein
LKPNLKEEKDMCAKKNEYHFLWKLVLLALILVTVGAPSAWATGGIKSEFLTAYPPADGSRLTTLPSAPNHCGACHFDFAFAPNMGDNLNPYGEAMVENGTSAAEILAIGSQDSDGDGYSNDEEITGTGFTNIPTFPGLEPSIVSQANGVSPTELTGFLVPVEAEPCESDDNCTEGQICEDGVCIDDDACESDDNCTEGEICVLGVCIVDNACPPDTPPEVLIYDTDGDCFLNKEELKNYKSTLKADQKEEKNALKDKQKAEKNQYKMIKKEYSIK